MKTFCEKFNHWFYHSVDTSLICDRRALKFPECRACRGIEVPKIRGTASKEVIPKTILLNVDKNEWIRTVKEIQGEYGIQEEIKRDGVSARRIAILLGELYLIRFKGDLSKVPMVEKDIFDLAMEFSLTCGDPLEREERVKGASKKRVLHTWGVDKASGMEGYVTQLKEWAAIALIVEAKEKEGVIENGELSVAGNDHRGRVDEGSGYEEIRTSTFKGRERDALR